MEHREKELRLLFLFLEHPRQPRGLGSTPQPGAAVVLKVSEPKCSARDHLHPGVESLSDAVESEEAPHRAMMLAYQPVYGRASSHP